MGVVYCDQLIQYLDDQKKSYQSRHEAAFVREYFSEPVPSRRDLAKEQEERIAEKARSVESCRYIINTAQPSFKLLGFQHYMELKKDLAEREKELKQLQQELYTVIPAQQAKEDQRRQKEYDAWSARKAAFEQKEKDRKEIYDQQGRAVCKEFDQSIQDTKAKRAEFCAMRDELYQEDILFEKFRNPIAESQIRDYLRMGLVTGLEGPQGGYAFYLNELQTQRICGTIEELRVSMETRLEEILDTMTRMVQEMRAANRRLSALGSALYNCCDTISAELRNNNSTITKMTSSLREELASQVRPIREAVQRSEYNIYLDGMRKELENYRYGRLQRPSIDLPR